MSIPIAGNQFFTTLENNPRQYSMLKTTTLKVGDSAFINSLKAKEVEITGDLNVDGTLTVQGTGSVFEQDLQVDGTLDVPNALSTLNSLEVTNASTLNGTSRLYGGLLMDVKVPFTSAYSLQTAEYGNLLYFNNVAGAATFDITLPLASGNTGAVYLLRANDLVNVANVVFKCSGGDTVEGLILDGAGTSATYTAATQVNAVAGSINKGDWLEFSNSGGTEWLVRGMSRVAGAFS